LQKVQSFSFSFFAASKLDIKKINRKKTVINFTIVVADLLPNASPG
tara:strand:- start:142 stop:279 length:138 start_codon:yes stop_codon:yes gene_type:complete